MPDPSLSKPRRLRYLAGVAVVVTIGVVVIQRLPEVERNRQAWMSAMVILLGLLLGLIWFLFLSGLSWRARGMGMLALVLAGFGVPRLVRVDGAADGRGMPKFTWRWNATRVSLPGAVVVPTEGVALPPVAGLADVPQYLGASRDGVVRDVKLARDWGAQAPKELWRHPVGAGWSAFAVAGGRAFTQEQRGENEAVTCYEVRTGQLLWMHTYPAHFSQWQGGDGPRATPTVDRDRVFAYGATGILSCLEAATGKAVWTRDILQENLSRT